MVMYQVNRILCKRHVLSQSFRYSHSEQRTTSILYPLQSRKLLKVAGQDAPVFLQGLITNDMNHFEEGTRSMYAMFLNNKGRVLFDTLIYKWQENDSFLLECDSKVLNLLQKHLKIYKLKRLVQIEDINKDFNVWALRTPVEFLPDCNLAPETKVNIYRDPRLVHLGYRVLASSTLNENEVASNITDDIEIEKSEEGYKYWRYQLGVSEGAEDLPPGTSFPLEVNCDYLHGVSFHKGCYIGQELTARVHHTGVVRKRMMPLKFTEEIKDDIEKDAVISASDNPKSNLGKIKGFVRDYGLGLIRIKEALEAKVLKIGKHSVEPEKPTWWPIEAPKEKLSTVKVE